MASVDSIELAKVAASPLPADYEDPNHPHFPQNLEAQTGQVKLPWYTKKKSLWALVCVGLLLTTLAAAALGGWKYAQRRAVAAQAPANASMTASQAVEWHTTEVTVTHLTTTQLNTTTIPPPTTRTLRLTPIGATTIWDTTTTVPFSAPLPPIPESAASSNVPSSSATPSSNAPPPATPSNPKAGNDCTEIGTYSSKHICQDHCDALPREGDTISLFILTPLLPLNAQVLRSNCQSSPHCDYTFPLHYTSTSSTFSQPRITTAANANTASPCIAKHTRPSEQLIVAQTSLPQFTSPELFPEHLPDRPREPSRFATLIRNPYLQAVVGFIAVLLLITLAVYIGIRLGSTQNQHRRYSSTEAIATQIPTTPLRSTQTVCVTMDSVVTQHITVELSSLQSTAWVTKIVPTPTVRCAGGAFSHPECQKGK
ncbi:hypothetical protein BU26DRAFT_504710 [Trematosphaeria pertusa]|uniref:Uncharacterized protein n=1 Tax=Trematosphaeria pertusa TaxID=390896 RepID=A0A6A6IJM5_9PLEO|nr:uncharacterized protein BU26DRAFT_504710 [Trematosphaeria pertusa]KAF2250377.1 hypothetical protein BU26DRAFT_504710 [Trematosphaeria pertusa]